MGLEIIPSRDLSASLRQEICTFLDSQDTAHPFQFPQWACAACTPPLSEFWSVLLRKESTLMAFASCGVQRPAGARAPVKALIINRGPVCDDPLRLRETLAELIRVSEDRGLVYIDAAPERTIPDRTNDSPDSSISALFPPSWKPIGGERLSLRLDLTRSEEEIFAGFRKVARYEIRRADRAGVAVTRALSGEESETFLDLYLRLAKRKGFTPDRPEFVQAVLKWLQSEPNRGALFLARREEVPIAGAVVVRAGRRCWYIWGASEDRRDFSAGHLLQWHAIRWAKVQGCTEYDFGGYTYGAKSGPAWFKQGFGGQVVRLLAPHRVVLRETQYWLLEVAGKAKRKLQRARTV